MTGNLFWDGALVLVAIGGMIGMGKLISFREKALAEAEEPGTETTEAQEIGVQL